MNFFKYYFKILKFNYLNMLISLKYRLTMFKYDIYLLLIKIYSMKNILIYILKYILIPVSVIFFLPCLGLNCKGCNGINSYDFIGILLPMVATIVTIALSLQNEEIYGISSYNFRRLNEGLKFNVLEMIIVIISILSLNTLSIALKNKVSFIYLNCLSFAYALIFCIQEILILIRWDPYLMHILKKFNKSHSSNNFKYGKDSKASDFDKVLEYLVLNKGINRTYLSLKTKSKDKNIFTFSKLLDISNKYLENLISNKEFILKSNNIEYLDKIKNFINMSTTELNLMFCKTDKFNPKLFLKNSDTISRIVLLTENLKLCSKYFNLDKEFEQNFKDLLNLFKLME